MKVKPESKQHSYNNITIPKPFKFDTRERDKKLTIREKKMMEMIKEAEEKKYGPCKQKYRASSIPEDTKKPLFALMMKEAEVKRRKFKSEA